MRRQGFSLIELLMAISIMALFIGIGVANFSEFTRRQEVDSLARRLTADLRSIEQDAASGIKNPSTCTGPLSGYEVFFNVNATGNGGGTRAYGYTLSSLCPSSPNTVRSVTFGQNQFVTINRNPANAKFVFKSLGSGTDIQSNNSLVITVANQNTQKTITITVDSTGAIQ